MDDSTIAYEQDQTLESAIERFVGKRFLVRGLPVLGLKGPCEICIHQVRGHRTGKRALYSTPVPPEWEPSDWASSLGLAWREGEQAMGFSELLCIPFVKYPLVHLKT
jgi:hypothetical protein